uniref:Sperm flagellar protein 1 n=1 Tax=Sphenodon punctatus TaxID=8508 RepID=A0A8D0HES8_SPHPU
DAVELPPETLHDLYSWVDGIPLSRPKRNIARDFSDGVLTAEVVKFYFPKMVEMHNYVPANSTQQKLSNWGHLNRKVLHKLNFSIPEDVVRKIAQCAPGVVELVLIPLRQKIEERQRQSKGASGNPLNPDVLTHHEYRTEADASLRLHLAEREQELLASQETVQLLQMKVRRLEHLLQLKNVRIDDLTRRLQKTEQKMK